MPLFRRTDPGRREQVWNMSILDRLVFRRRSQQRRRRIDLFEIAPDCRNLTDRSTVFQNECGYDASRIDRAVGIGVLLAAGETDRFKGDSDALLSQEDPTRREFGDAAEW